MKYAVLLLAASIPALAQIATTAAVSPAPASAASKGRIALGKFTELERRFDSSYFQMGAADTPIDLLGATRGLYLDGYGVVFTTELSLVLAPGISPFMPTISKEVADRVHRRKVERMPALRQKIRDLLRIAALSLVQVPEDQQIVIAVRLDYRNWENTAGLPGQILMRADRRSAMLGEVAVTEEQ